MSELISKRGYTLIILASMALLIALFFVGLGDAKTQLIFSFILAYFTQPLFVKLEKWGMPRPITVFVFFFLLLLVGVILSVLILPGLFNELLDLVKAFPIYLETFLQKVDQFFAAKDVNLNIDKEKLTLSLQEGMKEHSNEIFNYVLKSVSSAFSSVTNFILSILNLFLFPVFFFYLICDYEKVSSSLYELIPGSLQQKYSRYLELSNSVLSGFFRGQISVALLLGILYAIGLKIVGLKSGVVIGLIAGLISIIPYAGLFIGLSAAVIVSVANGGGLPQLIGIAVVFIIVQALEGFVITPKLVGGKVGLNPFETILALIIWGNLLGFPWILVGIPFSAIIKTLSVELFKEYKALDL